MNTFEQKKSNNKKSYEKPELTVLDVKDTETGPIQDPGELSGIFRPFS